MHRADDIPSDSTNVPALRLVLAEASRALVAAGLNTGSAGNLSVRSGTGMLITPSGIPAAEVTPESLVQMTLAGEAQGDFAPSSEWRFHADIYAARPEAGAIVHTHSPFATALACQRIGIPAFHYMIARFGGDSVRCAHYATFGTQRLSDHILEAMIGRSACLIANHGMVVFGRDVNHALALAIELETLCEQYWRTLQLGDPVLLSATEMAEVMVKFSDYGKQPSRT